MRHVCLDEHVAHAESVERLGERLRALVELRFLRAGTEVEQAHPLVEPLRVAENAAARQLHRRAAGASAAQRADLLQYGTVSGHPVKSQRAGQRSLLERLNDLHNPKSGHARAFPYVERHDDVSISKWATGHDLRPRERRHNDLSEVRDGDS